ncbi:MAG TPA: hypothetical protein VFC19_45610 [Candidatus Limnocylindrales bacterium]|nr:hypothetical protein [Candidatus Limnocylindrales bacterium]
MRFRVGAALGAILLSLTSPATTAAGSPPSSGEGIQYYWLNCPPDIASTGTIVEIGADHGRLHMKYTVTPCVPPEAATAMAIGFYQPDGKTDGQAHPYAPNTLKAAGVPVGAQATCLLAAQEIRLDCYELTWAREQVTVGQRISTADPRVAAVQEIELYLVLEDEDNPECHLCV